jgi:hypothetical protein
MGRVLWHPSPSSFLIFAVLHENPFFGALVSAKLQEVSIMAQKPITSLTIDTHIRCKQIYPKEKEAAYKDLATMGVKLSREEALHLARAILAATQEWEEIELVVHRFDKLQSDNTYLLSVVPEHHEVTDPEFVQQIQHHVPEGTDMPADIEEIVESLNDLPMSD